MDYVRVKADATQHTQSCVWTTFVLKQMLQNIHRAAIDYVRVKADVTKYTQSCDRLRSC